MIKKTPLLSKAAADIRETARLKCEASGVPDVTFAWHRSGGSFISSSSTKEESNYTPVKYRTVDQQLDPLTWRSELVIYNVSSSDYGLYECVARNTEGSSRHKISLDVKSRPDAPRDLRLLNVTHEEAHLSWTPGFDGGMDQYFRLRYRTESGRQRIEDVYPANVISAVLEGLKPGTRYSIWIMAFNNMGESNYTREPVIITTAGKLFLLRRRWLQFSRRSSVCFLTVIVDIAPPSSRESMGYIIIADRMLCTAEAALTVTLRE